MKKPQSHPEAQVTDLAAAAKALGHPVRLELLRLLLLRGSCVCGSLVEAVSLAQSTVSQHLKVLKDAGLVVGTIQGPATCYCADPARLRAVAEGLTALADLAPSLPSTGCSVDGENPCCPPAADPTKQEPA